jgi:hypothetical protein
MNATKPILTFRVSIRSEAPPDAVYDILSDPTSHLVWAGEEAPREDFRLLSMDAAPRSATVGDRFSSTGANSNGTFHDGSDVVEAARGSAFGFDTGSTLERKHGKTWHARFTHRYSIEPSADGTLISYTCEVWPQNYVPWWLKPGLRSMTLFMVQRMMRRNLGNLAAMAVRTSRT